MRYKPKGKLAVTERPYDLGNHFFFDLLKQLRISPKNFGSNGVLGEEPLDDRFCIGYTRLELDRKSVV